MLRLFTSFTTKKSLRLRFASSARSLTSSSSSFEVDTTTFGEKVINSPVPVILDCYADWCGPCKQLAPLLEAAVQKAEGKVVLAKLDVDKNQPIAQQLQVQSLPTVFGLFEQKLVNKFVGMIDSKAIDEFVDQMIAAGSGSSSSSPREESSSFDIENATPEEAFNFGFKAYRDQDFKTALSCFDHVYKIEQNESSEDKRTRRQIERQEKRSMQSAAQQHARAAQEAAQQGRPVPPPPPLEQRATLEELVVRGMSLSALSEMATGNMSRAESLVEEIKKERDEEHQNLPDVSRTIALVEISADVANEDQNIDPNQLVSAIEQDENDHATRLRLCKLLAAVGEFPSAVDHALEVMKRDRNFNEGEAKTFLLRIFNVLGPQHEVSKEGRRRLSNYIF